MSRIYKTYIIFIQVICSGILAGVLLSGGLVQSAAPQPENPQSGSVGLEGTISAPAPTQAATISFPTNGQTVTTLPITVTGLCPNNTLVKLFKNGIFGGSAQCNNGSYSITADLFVGTNELIVRVYDELDQAGPDSRTITVTYNDSNFSAAGSRPSLTSNYAKRGANPGDTLSWPISLSGGSGPYAISVDWGDGSTPDLISQEFPGVLTITHAYDSAGVYNIVVKVTDSNGSSGFLQLVGVANGSLSQTNQDGSGAGNDTTSTRTRVLWWPMLAMLPLLIITFWLGRRHQMTALRRELEKQHSTNGY